MRQCACGCDAPMDDKRCDAKWYSDACRERAKRRRNGSTGRIGRPPKTDRYRVDVETGCWIWLLAQMGPEPSYSCVWDGARGRMVQAHIVMWEAEHGPVPTGCELHHTCERRLCVNPEHLIPLTREAHAALHVVLRAGKSALSRPLTRRSATG